MLLILCLPIVSTAWQLPSSRTARTPSARMCGCVTWPISGVSRIGQNMELKWQQLSSRRTNRIKRSQCSSHGQRWQHHRLSSSTANLKSQLPMYQHQKRPVLIRDRCSTRSLCWKASKRTRTPKLADPCKGSAHASCRSSRLSKFRFRFVLRPAMLAQLDQRQCTHARKIRATVQPRSTVCWLACSRPKFVNSSGWLKFSIMLC